MLRVIVLVFALAALSAVQPVFAATPGNSAAALVPIEDAGSSSSRAAESAGGAEAPRVGELAPDFELPAMDGGKAIRLSSFRGARPVLMVFGSYT